MADMHGEHGTQPAAAGDVAAGGVTADDVIAEQAAELAAQVSEAPGPQERRRLARSLAEMARSGVRVTGRGVRVTRRRVGTGTGWLAAQVAVMAPRLRVRDRVALQAQFPGLPTEDIADALVEGASRAAAAVGAAVGAWAVLPVPPAFPAEIAAETLALVGIEIKLVAELHEIYGLPASGNGVERMTAYVAAWAHRRGVFLVPGGLALAAGSPLARRLRLRLAARAGRSAFSLGPLLTGAVAGAVLNRRETHRLGRDIRSDLRRHAGPAASAP
jgi:hypothetical protein